MWVVSINRPVNPLHFQRLKFLLKFTPALYSAKNVFEWLHCKQLFTWICGQRHQKFDTVVNLSAIDLIAGDVPLISCFKKICFNTFQGSKDSGWCLPTIEMIAGRTHCLMLFIPGSVLLLLYLSFWRFHIVWRGPDRIGSLGKPPASIAILTVKSQ